ncbi:MAG: L,D-transpeptidase family protein [Legionellaceae bacterium]|nr:L,D-transpeptidase family protein [Legionellaceae bacterium]
MYRLIFVGLLLFLPQLHAMSSHVKSNVSVDKAIAKYSLKKEPQLKSIFKKAKISYPPKNIALLAFKKEQKIQLWAKDNDSSWRYIKTYPLTASSGGLGPKLKQYDKQIPEGIYKLTMFNPFSTMHLSMMIDYPNNFDKSHANLDGRSDLGGDIFLHGKSYSVGCLAVGNTAIEQLFLLARRVGLSHIQVIIAPNDLRIAKPATNKFSQPRWLPELYRKIELALNKFPLSNKKTV